MEGLVNVEWHGQDYHLKWHVVCSGLATPVIYRLQNSNKTQATHINGECLYMDISRIFYNTRVND